jgi:hypothetical protein
VILKTGYTFPSLIEKKSNDPDLPELFNQVKAIIEEMTGLKSPIQIP